MSRLEIKRFHVHPGEQIHLFEWDPDDTSSYDGTKKDALNELVELKKKLEELQEKLYAEQKHKVLIVLQAMDTGGKDSTIRLVFEGINPQGVKVVGFKAPTPEEKSHDFLWRIHARSPRNGQIVIFNRSHYEGVLIERVHSMVPENVWRKRYDQINEFEKILSEEGTLILKFYLHISKEEQKKRLEDRLNDPTKEWKFSVNDLLERQFWKAYIMAYEDALSKTSSEKAPWYIVPANHKWFRDYIVASAIVNHLEKLDMKYPMIDKPTRDHARKHLES